MRFREGDTDVKDKSRPGPSKKIDCDGILAAIEENPTLTTRMLAEPTTFSAPTQKLRRFYMKKERNGVMVNGHHMN